MAITNAIYDAVPCTQDNFGRILASFLSDGYISDYGSELEVVAADPASMKVLVLDGRAHILGRYYSQPDIDGYELPISSNTSGSPRIDRIILRLDIGTTYQISARVIEGTTSAPALTRSSTVWEISLAQITVASGAATITDLVIVDERDDYSVCGIAGVKPFKFSETTVNTNLPLGGYKAINIGTPSADGDAANLTYFNTKLDGGKFGPAPTMILPWISATAPAGWLLCNGQSLSTSTYPGLFAQMGYTFGGSSGTFNLPDLSGRMPIGAESSLGVTSGSNTVTLDTAMIASHAHPKCGAIVTLPPGSGGGTEAISATSGNTANTGGGGAHNNLQPYITLTWIVWGS
jgi:microcystin-dependent protein